MSDGRFARIEALFNAVCDLPEAERAARLTAEPDAGLRAEVERLLGLHSGATAVLGGALDSAVLHAATPPVRERIGAYRLIRELGAGGMGTVFLAERRLGDTVQRVALKLIRGFPTAEARYRLGRERSLLASLNHPNIARLLDGGESEDGQPYLVMEFIDGAPLLQHCLLHVPDFRARLALFVQLCLAVQHAHQRLILHRDIKPANVLVREDGAPVLLDFGIGKLLDSTAAHQAATATRVFTPAYAAPEQRAGRGVTTATDIYGLGCVLFELLAGRLVAEVGGGQRELPAPSACCADPARARELRGELDTLVLKAVHAEPERRYASAQALADDIENFLHGRPLQAAPDSVFYRTRKFLARHRLGVGVAALLAVLSAVFVWRLETERQRAIAAEARAEREAQSTRRSRDFLVSLFEASSPDNALGRQLDARELIDRGRERIATQLKDEPQAAARLAQTVAGVYSALGDPKAAVTAGEEALRLAAGDAPELALLRAEILGSLSSDYDNLDRFDDATRALDEALALTERHAPEDPARLAAVLASAGHVAARHGDYPKARGYLERALGLHARLGPPDPVQHADALRGLAVVEVSEGNAAASIARTDEGLALLAGQPALAPARIELWRVKGRAQADIGDAEGGVQTLRQALDVARTVLGPENNKVANIENDLATMLSPLGRYREAITHLETSLAITRKLRPDDAAGTAVIVENLGSMYESLGDYARAEALMREGIAALEQGNPGEPLLPKFRANLARTLALRGQLDAALALGRTALDQVAAAEGRESFHYGVELFRYTRIEIRAGRLDEAQRDLDAAYALLDAQLPAEHALRAHFRRQHGLLAWAHHDLAGARREIGAAVEALGRLKSNDPVALAEVRSELAEVLLASGDAAGARRTIDRALPVLAASLIAEAPVLKKAEERAAAIMRTEAAAPVTPSG